MTDRCLTAALTSVAGRLPPQALDVEAVVLAACLLDVEALAATTQILQPADFYSDANRLIFQGCQALADAGATVDVVAIASWLRDREQIQRIGGAVYLGELIQDAPAVADVRDSARHLAELARRRTIIATAQRVAAEGYGAVGEDWVSEVAGRFADGAAGPRSAIEWISTADIFAPVAPVDWAVPDLQIATGRPTLWAGFGGSMKTLTVQSMGLSLAAGHKVFGELRCPGALTVRHLDMEQGSSATRRRYQRLALGQGVDLDSLAGRLELVSFPALYLSTGSMDAWRRAADGAGLVILDSLLALCPGVLENDSTIRTHVDKLTRISEETGVVWVVLHHAGKPSEQRSDSRTKPRGSSAIYDSMGCAFLLTGAGQEPRRVQQIKTPADAEGGEVEPFYLLAEDVPSGGNTRAGVRVVYRTVEQACPEPTATAQFDALKSSMLAVVRTSGRLASRNAIVARVKGGNKQNQLQAIRELLDSGELIEHPDGGLHVVGG